MIYFHFFVKHIMNRYTIKLQLLQENNSYDDVEEDEDRDITYYNHQSMPAINVRMLNYNKPTRIKDLKPTIYDEFISVTGTVVRISNIRLYVKRLAFECQGCKTTFVSIYLFFSFSFFFSFQFFSLCFSAFISKIFIIIII